MHSFLWSCKVTSIGPMKCPLLYDGWPLSQTQAGHIWGYVLCMSHRIPIRTYYFILFHTTFDVCTSSVFHSYISNYTCILLSPDLHHSLPFPQFLAPYVFPVLLSSASKAKKSFKVVMEGVALRHNSTCFSVKWGICNNLSVTVCNPSSWRISKEKPLWRSMSIQNHKKRTVLCSQLQVANDHSKLVWPSKKTVDKEYYDRT